MSEKSHFIANDWKRGTGADFASIDPATDKAVWYGAEAVTAEVDEAVEAARAAFEAWANKDPADRANYLKAFAESLKAEKPGFAEAISRDTGKPLWESLTEVSAMIGKIELSLRAYSERCGTVVDQAGEAQAATRFRPHGVIAVFGPFNLPGHLPNAHIVPALQAGNTVVFKPSEQAALVGEKLVELWESADLPPGVLNMVQGGRSTGTALAGHQGLNGLFFTGSAQTGKALHRAFGGHPERILALEMGGNNPLVVFEVSDIDSAAYVTLESAYITAGQRCTCARRLIVPRGAEGDRFVARIQALIGAIRVGACTERPEPFMGPVISHQAADALLKAQEALAEAGGSILVPMASRPGKGSFLSPGLMDVTEVGQRPDEELFGPFLQVIRVSDFDEAVREANRTAYGLAAGLLSDDKGLYERFLRRVRAGIINWNRQTTGASGTMPFGGVGQSGNHRPSGYFAADYCSYPTASLEIDRLKRPSTLLPGMPS
jgi:succinylglutamic semialdehyde dehydrogenase